MATYTSATLLLASRLTLRWSDYFRGILDLTLEMSVEPRRWIGCAESFWKGVADDTSGWLRSLADRSSGPLVDELPGMLPIVLLAPGQRVSECEVPVPRQVFDLLKADYLQLIATPLCRGETEILRPWTHIVLQRSVVSRREATTHLRLKSLPRLSSGIELRGLLWAMPAEKQHHQTQTLASMDRHSSDLLSGPCMPIASVCVRIS